MRLHERIILIVWLSCFATSSTIRPGSRTNHDHHGQSHGAKISRRNDDFDIADGLAVSSPKTSEDDTSMMPTRSSERGIDLNPKRAKRIDDVDGSSKIRHKGQRRRKQNRRTENEQERGWHYCSDGSKPKSVKDLNETLQNGMGYMCGNMYPTSTCCYNHDLNMELVGDKILEQIPKHECVRMLTKLRCAHCSPRSWWLFHAPDMMRLPHKRVLPIMCPYFCRRFHRICRNYVAGLEDNDFCDYHTTNEEGPCFPDSITRHGSID